MQAEFDEKKFGNPMHPYNCDTCGKWHVAPRTTDLGISRGKDSIALRKSSTCFGKATGTALLEFESERRAQEQAFFDEKKHGTRMYTYQCACCGKYHLAPNAPYATPVSTKSRTCRSSQGKGLSEYRNRADADSAANYCSDQLSIGMVSYRCLQCQKWHISPADRQTQSRPWCDNSCRDSKGVLKDAYYTQQDAERRASILWQENRVQLCAYQCPASDMWHLTHGMGMN